nr:MAG TPA: hypothetical protein [Caudoviricetes sp.]
MTIPHLLFKRFCYLATAARSVLKFLPYGYSVST